MPAKQYRVSLKPRERSKLRGIIRKGRERARVITRARILLAADKGKTDGQIARELEVSLTTPRDVRMRYVDGGIERALYDAPRPGQPPKLTGKDKARVCALACTSPPDGYGRWTLDLLTAHSAPKLKHPVCRTAIWKVLLKNELKPWREKNVVHSADRPGV